ncbi:iron ABC transporter permease [Leptolyngbya sp. 'hensonii']|uniref:ABC transporter permease n=1 Tax=Leptolyngbya sp. 'hensonii' TaxID=1922337 RepID=UPI00209AE1A2|nr:iron ABC transporter permease [Leptolyngbya sp. 'hensonii']
MATVALPAVAIILPLAYLILRTLSVSGDQLVALILRHRTIEIILNSAGLAIITPLCATCIAVPIAFLTTRTDLPWRRFWLITTILPLAVPDYVICFALIATFGPKGSLLQHLVEPLGIEVLPEIYGWHGAILALTLITYPYLLLSVQAGLQRMNPSLEEAAQSLGHGPYARFFRIILPQLSPFLATGGLIVAMYALQDFSAATLMRFDAFTRAIFIQYRYTYDRYQPAVLALLLVGLMMSFLWLEHRVRSRAAFFTRTSTLCYTQPLIHLGCWKLPALLFCLVVVLLGLVLPIGVTLFWFIQGLTHQGWSYDMSPFSKLMELTWHSIWAAGWAAVVSTLCGLSVGILAVRFPHGLTTLIERCSYIGFGLPGVVVAFSIVYWGANYAPSFYQTLPMLVFAYLVMFLPQSVGTIRSSLLQVNPQLEDSARSLGRNAWQTFKEVTLPLIAPGVLSGAVLVFLTALKELPATLLLAPIGFNTLSVHIWKSTESVSYSDAAAGALLMLMISLGLTLPLLSQNNLKELPADTIRLRDFD